MWRSGVIFEYLIFQIVGRVGLVYGLVSQSANLALIGIAVKLGVFPFVVWPIRVGLGVVSLSGLIIILAIQKILPLGLVSVVGVPTE